MPFRWTAIALGLALATAAPAAAGEAKGSFTYQGTTVTLKHAYLVRGPDALDPAVTIRRLILTSADLGAKIAACTTVSCADGDVTEGMTVDLGSGPRLNYWVVMRDGLTQYSGTTPPESLKATTDTPDALAGTLAIDGTAAGGPKIEVTVDTKLLKSFERAR